MLNRLSTLAFLAVSTGLIFLMIRPSEEAWQEARNARTGDTRSYLGKQAAMECRQHKRRRIRILHGSLIRIQSASCLYINHCGPQSQICCILKLASESLAKITHPPEKKRMTVRVYMG